MFVPSKTAGLRVLLFSAALLVAQWLLVQHLVQVEAHAAGDSCEWCLTHVPLAGALPVVLPVLPVVALHTPPVAARIDFIAVAIRPAYSPRAPPHVSSV